MKEKIVSIAIALIFIGAIMGVCAVIGASIGKHKAETDEVRSKEIAEYNTPEKKLLDLKGSYSMEVAWFQVLFIRP